MNHSDGNGFNDVNDDKTTPYQPVPHIPAQSGEGTPYISAPQNGSVDEEEQRYQEYMHPGSYRPLSVGQQPKDTYPRIPASAYPLQPNQETTDSYRPDVNPAQQPVGNNYAQHGYVPYTGVPVHSGTYGPPATPATPPMSGQVVRRSGPRTGAIIALTVIMALIFGTGLFAGWQFGRTGAVTSFRSDPLQQSSTSQITIPALSDNNVQAVREAVIAKTRPGVVQINVTTPKGQALGSGVIIDKRGYIVTNNHVVDGVQKVDEVVLSDGTRIRNATVVGRDPADDLAIIKINPPANIVVVPLGDSSQLRVGQDVLAIGNPLGNTQTVTNGIVSALGRNVSESNGATIPNTIQTDAPINPGNSGGALVDLKGQLVGIPTLTAVDPEFNSPANGVGFAIPSNRVQFIATQLINTGSVQHTGRAAIGIRPTSVDQTLQMQDGLAVSQGVFITQLVFGGAAEKAGLKAGDVIVQIDNKTISSISTLQDALISKNPGDAASVKVYRGNQQMTFTVTLGELQSGS